MSSQNDGIAAFLGQTNQAVGMGVVVDRRHVLTCAHVVTEALGSTSPQEKPVDKLSVIFPFSTSPRQSTPITATVLGWHSLLSPGEPTGRIHDVAVVRLDEEVPEDVGFATLHPANPTHATPFTAYRYVTGNQKGQYAKGEVVGPANDGTFEFHAPNYIADFIQGGFSGGGCWSAKPNQTGVGHTLGIVVTVRADSTKRIAHMIPSTALLRALEAVRVSVPDTVDDAPLRKLRDEAVACLRDVPEAAEILVEKMKSVLDEAGQKALAAAASNARCEALIEALAQPGLDHALAARAIFAAFREAKNRGGVKTRCAAALVDACFLLLPTIYQPAILRTILSEAPAGKGAVLSLPISHNDSVELFMAAADGRKYRPPRPSLKGTTGPPVVPSPPETGLDGDGGQYREEVQKHLVEKGIIKVDNWPRTQQAAQNKIRTALRVRLEWEEFRYYLIYDEHEDQLVRERRKKILTQLVSDFPTMVFVGRDPTSYHPDEEEIVQSLFYMLRALGEENQAP